MSLSVFKWGFIICLFLSTGGCSPSVTGVDTPNSVQHEINPMEKEGQVNPLEKEGQIARFLLRVKPAELEKPFAGALNIDGQGFLDIPKADFKVLGNQGDTRATGQVKENALELFATELGKGPFRLEVALPNDAVLLAELDEILPEETRVLTAKHVQILSSQQSCGDNCTQISGNTKIETGNVKEGCVGVVVNCSIGPQEPKKSPEPVASDAP